ncbi:MAG: putative extra-cytoplasmic solute receptor [Pseudomonadota bacterium]|jgi:tripartite-type tricarboxylate transporter receptor subunit TctC
MNLMLKKLLRCLGATLLGCCAGLAAAQNWPTKPVRMVIAFPPGGPTDIVSRVIAQQLSQQLGQSVVVDNKPGAGGNIAAELVAKAPADGHTVFYNTSAIVIGPALYGKVNYDTLNDFAPVALTASVPLVLVVNPKLPVRSVKEFIDHARANPDKLNYSSSGTGTITHLASAMFSSQLGLKTQHVPYKGSAPGLVDLAAGQTQFMIDTMNTVLPYVRDGRLRALGVASLQRSALLPDVPTLAETVPGFEAAAWQGVVVPAATQPDIVVRLNQEVNKALQHPEVRAKLAAQGADVLGGSMAEYAAYLRTEMPRWAKAVRDSGAKAE